MINTINENRNFKVGKSDWSKNTVDGIYPNC